MRKTYISPPQVCFNFDVWKIYEFAPIIWPKILKKKSNHSRSYNKNVILSYREIRIHGRDASKKYVYMEEML